MDKIDLRFDPQGIWNRQDILEWHKRITAHNQQRAAQRYERLMSTRKSWRTAAQQRIDQERKQEQNV